MGKLIPEVFMPPCKMQRVIMHWTAGASSPSSEDKEFYHLLIDRVGHVHKGDHAITDQLSTADGDYAAHTRGLNTGSIGLALCGMAGATENPFAPGPFALTRVQWNAGLIVAAQLCRRYGIVPDERGLLMHCEVGRVYEIRQAGKWDVSVLTFARGKYEWATPGEEMRARVSLLLREG